MEKENKYSYTKFEEEEGIRVKSALQKFLDENSAEVQAQPFIDENGTIKISLLLVKKVEIVKQP